jgi:Ca2+-binding RTX toxin-like protein
MAGTRSLSTVLGAATAGLGALLLASGIAPPSSAEGAVPTCAGRRATITGTPGDDRILGTTGPDVIAAGAGADVVRGRGSDDVVCGGPGRDDLRGGLGADRLLGGRDELHSDRGGTFTVGDRLRGGPGQDRLVGGADRRTASSPDLNTPDTLDFTGAVRGVTVDLADGTASGQGRDTLAVQRYAVIGSAHGDELIGSAEPERLFGQGGTDRVHGRGGADELWMDPVEPRGRDSSDDLATGGRGSDVLDSRGGDDVLRAGPGADELLASSGSTDVLGGDGEDRVALVVQRADQGAVVDGGAAGDSLRFESRVRQQGELVEPGGVLDLRREQLLVAAPTPVVLQVRGFSRVDLPSGEWRFVGTDAGEEVAALGTGPVDLRGAGGDDVLFGSPQGDRLDGGEGTDSAWPGGGLDTCLSIETVLSPQPCETAG